MTPHQDLTCFWDEIAGCMFHSKGGLMSFDHPMNKRLPRVDSEGEMCGPNFKEDT